MLAYGQSGFRCQSRCPDNANTDYLNCTAHCMSFRCRQSRDGQIAAAKVIAHLGLGKKQASAGRSVGVLDGVIAPQVITWGQAHLNGIPSKEMLLAPATKFDHPQKLPKSHHNPHRPHLEEREEQCESGCGVYKFVEWW